MEKLKGKIVENKEVAKNYFRMVMELGDTFSSSHAEPVTSGQFVNLELPDLYLRRPISICDFESAESAECKGLLTLIYKIVGKGTEEMAGLNVGQELDLLIPLGHGFNVEKAGEHPVLIGGGVGAAPLYFLAKEIIRANPKAQITVLLGFNTKDEILLESEFETLLCKAQDIEQDKAGTDKYNENQQQGKLDCSRNNENKRQGHTLQIYTVDGSYGTKGFAADGLDELAQGAAPAASTAGAAAYTYFYACGPMPMFRAIEAKAKGDGEYSFEERMGCGFGACMGCSHKTKNGFKRICKDGPVLSRGEILWD